MRYLIAIALCGLVVVAVLRSTRGGPSDEPLTSAAQLSELCRRGTSFSDAAPYAAETPRTVAVFEPPAGNGGDDRVERLPAQLQGERRDPYPQWDTSDPTMIELVACVRRASEGEQVGECRFDSGEPVPLHAASYEVTVYEARTGEEVGSYDSGWDGEDCPAVALTDAQRPRVFSPLPREELMRSLFAFVGAPPAPDVADAGDGGVTVSGDWTGTFTEAISCLPPALSEVPSGNVPGFVVLDGPGAVPVTGEMLSFRLRPDQTVYDGSIQLAGHGFSFPDAARGRVVLEALPSGERSLRFDGLELVDPAGSGAVRLEGSLGCA